MTYIILLIIVFVLLFIANKIVNKMFTSVGMYSEPGNRSYQYQLIVTTLDGKNTEMTFYSYHSGRTFDSILIGTKRVRMDNNYLYLKTQQNLIQIPRNMIVSIHIEESKLEAMNE